MRTHLLEAALVPAFLLGLATGALAAPPALVVLQSGPDLRAVVGTALAGVAGGIALAILDRR